MYNTDPVLAKESLDFVFVFSLRLNQMVRRSLGTNNSLSSTTVALQWF